MARDLTRKMTKDSDRPECYEATVPLWDPLQNKRFEDDMLFALPFEELDVQVTKGIITSIAPALFISSLMIFSTFLKTLRPVGKKL